MFVLTLQAPQHNSFNIHSDKKVQLKVLSWIELKRSMKYRYTLFSLAFKCWIILFVTIEFNNKKEYFWKIWSNIIRCKHNKTNHRDRQCLKIMPSYFWKNHHANLDCQFFFWNRFHYLQFSTIKTWCRLMIFKNWFFMFLKHSKPCYG
jgi:hypothetical protein